MCDQVMIGLGGFTLQNLLCIICFGNEGFWYGMVVEA